MKTGFRGTFVISWSQTELGGQWSGALRDLTAGTVWRWTGAINRVDGPNSILPLGDAINGAVLQRRAANSAQRIIHGFGYTPRPHLDDDEPLKRNCFRVTDGHSQWEASVLRANDQKSLLIAFDQDIPPKDTDLWLVESQISADLLMTVPQQPNNATGFLPGTLISTPDGPRDVASLYEGDSVLTKRNGTAEVLWVGRKYLSGARLHVTPSLRPITFKPGALGGAVSDEELRVSPDHHVMIKGAHAEALFNTDEVLVKARDLINGTTICRDNHQKGVTYIHIVLAQHSVIFANGVATESYHPANAQDGSYSQDTLEQLQIRLSDLQDDPYHYGAFARRQLSKSEAAILRHRTKQF
jgi:hypothetical protein